MRAFFFILLCVITVFSEISKSEEFTATTVTSGTTGYSYMQDITCPPQPAIREGVCAPVCPEGYYPSPTSFATDIQKTGVYYCYPDLESASADDARIYKRCVYFNPNCGSGKTQREAVEKLVKSQYAKYLQLGSDTETLVDKITNLITFDPDYINKIENENTNSIYLFFADTFKEIEKKIREESIFYLLFGSLWILAIVLGSKVVDDMRDYSQLRSLKLWGTRIAAGMILLFFPIPHYTETDGTVKVERQPLSFDLVRLVVSLGNKAGNALAEVGTEVFIKHMLNYASSNYADQNELLKSNIEKAKKDVAFLEQELKTCWKIYGEGTEFLVPADELHKITMVISEDELALIPNYRQYSQAYCQKREMDYKTTVSQYNILVAQLYSSEEVADALKNLDITTDLVTLADAYSEEDVGLLTDPLERLKLSIAFVAKAQKELGWISYPTVTFTVYQASNSIFEGERDLVAGLGIEEPGFISRMIAYLSMPPGSLILSFLSELNKNAAGVFTELVTSFGPGKLLSLVEKIAGGKIAKAIEAAGYGIVLVVSYIATKAFLDVFPILLLVGAVIARFILWLVDILKTMIVSPFVALHAFSLRRHEAMWSFFIKVLSLGMFPAILIISSFIAFALINLVKLLFYHLTMYSLTTLAKLGYLDIIQFGIPFTDKQISMGGSFILWILGGMVYLFSLLIQAYLLYKIVLTGPEWFMEKAGYRDLSTGHSASLSREIVEITKKGGSPI
jgi:hypothetical protein